MNPYRSIEFDWLASPDSPNSVVEPDLGDVGIQCHVLPKGFGENRFETLNLSPGMTMFRAENTLAKAAIGQVIPIGEIDVVLNGLTFQAQIMRGGRVLEKQPSVEMELMLSPGVDLFRYSDGYRIMPMLDGSSDSRMTCLSIDRRALDQLIGEGEAAHLLEYLQLLPAPRVITKPIPLYVSAHLHNSISTTLGGAARRLYCQARALDYLSALLDYTKAVPTQSSSAGQRRSQEVREMLLNAHGKLPTLNELGSFYCCSARTLNSDFSAVFGVSIYAFITSQRLMEAHEAILKSNVALKELSYKLGYAHVNHFSAAFRKKFGYPPGSLRRARK